MFFGFFKKNVKVVTVKRKSTSSCVDQEKISCKKSVKKEKSKSSAGRRKKVVYSKKALVKSKEAAPRIIGNVTHYFSNSKAAVVMITGDAVSLGDNLLFKGYTTDFKQKVSSLQINSVPIEKAKTGQEVGLQVKNRVRTHDVVYKI